MSSLLSSLRQSLSTSDPLALASSRASTTPNTTPTTPHLDHKITLRDNTHAPPPPDRVSSTINSTTQTTPVASVFDLRPYSSHGSNSNTHDIGGTGAGGAGGGGGNELYSPSSNRSDSGLRKAMARRKYSKWSAEAYGRKDARGVAGEDVTGGGKSAAGGAKSKPNNIKQKLRDTTSTASSTTPTTITTSTTSRSKKPAPVPSYSPDSADGGDPDHISRQNLHPPRRTGTSATATTAAVNEGSTLGDSPRRKGSKGSKKGKLSEIDVLYENQRGFFMCGIPLFSANSLLNFDPTPWQTREFKPSQVSILDMQCPDPSWCWAWKTWYVDMTPDVDDQGWAYSFSFNRYFSWHGTHVWFHSFVRRRRWLRKRVKLVRGLHDPTGGVEEEGHRFNQDYFTIHSSGKGRRRGSGWSAAGAGGGWRGRGGGGGDVLHDDGADEGERPGTSTGVEEGIADLPRLERVLKGCTLDRERTWAVKRFLDGAGDEVMYLSERIPSLMARLTYQASRRDLLAYILAALSSAERDMQALKPPSSRPTSPSPSQSPLQPTLISPFAIPGREGAPGDENLSRGEVAGGGGGVGAERRVAALREAARVAREEVGRMEFGGVEGLEAAGKNGAGGDGTARVKVDKGKGKA